MLNICTYVNVTIVATKSTRWLHCKKPANVDHITSRRWFAFKRSLASYHRILHLITQFMYHNISCGNVLLICYKSYMYVCVYRFAIATASLLPAICFLTVSKLWKYKINSLDHFFVNSFYENMHLKVKQKTKWRATNYYSSSSETVQVI